jgi:hypothetical protein
VLLAAISGESHFWGSTTATHHTAFVRGHQAQWQKREPAVICNWAHIAAGQTLAGGDGMA